MPKELPKTYDPKQFEDKTYEYWESNGYFTPERDPNKKPYTIVIPPPNITAQLHMGHALDNTLQDILIRFRRMQGFSALWLPGTDHASIATEAKIVVAMKEEGVTKKDLGREKFLERAWEWKETYSGRIISQLKKLGSSCDWTRERFTLDEGCSKAVLDVFIKLYEKGLIYRGERIINWCPTCKTSISDAEVEHSEKDGHFWHLRYPLSDGDGYIELATTRPETMLGDTAVAVHPDDERYQKYIGKTVTLPLVGREIPVIADSYVDMGFGTGVVKITPAHDPNDFEVGLRHNLEVINVLTEQAFINENGGKYKGLERHKARKAIVSDLEEQGFLVRIEDHAHNVGACYRCNTIVEPWVSKQWFVKMNPLAKPAIETVKKGEIKIIPERFEKTYMHWMENSRDWCISRQLWWGHRIPAYYCECGETIVSKEKPTVCPKCGSNNVTQDDDTLDTWFSSALWPFSTLGWPEKSADFDYFYPTNTLVTGYDILGFWVSRMIFSGLEYTNLPPFDTVLIHGLIRDENGRKMSKSLGNGIDPLEVIDEYGADALRFTLATGNSPGNDMRFSPEKVKSSRNFANKIWNATRFILMNLSDEITDISLPKESTLCPEDKWVLTKYNNLVKEVTENLENFEIGVATAKLYDFIWDILCDWYIELTKSRIFAGGEQALLAQKVLLFVLANTLKLLHPIMPFITEEIWHALPTDNTSIMLSDFPIYDDSLNFGEDADEFERVMDAIRAIRNARAEMNIPPSKKSTVYIETVFTDTFKNGIPFIQHLASASDVKIGDKFDIDSAIGVVSDGAKISIPMAELIDRDKELERLNREKANCEKDIAIISGKLSNDKFVANAPAQLVSVEKEKLAKANERMAIILDSLAKL